MTGANGSGCILADEMGLGKTLQTIALIHTLLSRTALEGHADGQSSRHGRTNRLCELTDRNAVDSADPKHRTCSHRVPSVPGQQLAPRVQEMVTSLQLITEQLR